MELKMINTDLVNIGDIEFINELNTYILPNRVYYRYIEAIRNSQDLDYETVRKKLIRDIILGVELPERKGMEHKQVFSYGNLLIHLNKEERSICYIKNIKNRIDKNKKRVLNEIMGIDN